MTQSQETEVALAYGQMVMGPGVHVAGATLAQDATDKLVRVEVDLHVNLPDTFELTFLDSELTVLDTAGLRLGSKLQVLAGIPGEAGTRVLIDGEVTALQGSYGEGTPYTRVRGCTLDHRLQRVRRTRSFVNAKDSDLARQLAGDAGVAVGTVDTTAQTHPHLAQDNQTDWQFLRERAEEIGYELGVADGKLYFRKAGSVSGPAPIPVHAGLSLTSFEPRVSSAGLVPEVEVRAWDPVNARAKAVRTPISSPFVSIGAGDAAGAARLFASPSAAAPAGSAELGPPPSTQAHVVWDRAVTVDADSTQALTDTAGALAERLASGFAEAEGEMLGDGRVVAGAVLDVDGVPAPFKGKWTVTRARHVFDHNTGLGYRTQVTVSGRQDRSILALSGGGETGNNHGPTRIGGVVGGVVTALDDPLGLGRVKVALPWLAPDYESAWAPVPQLTAGKATGAMFLPEVGDQVLVAFEFGDLRRPYVLGSVINKRTGAGGMVEPGGDAPGKAAVKAGRPATVIRRGFLSPSGNRLVFYDDGPPGGGRPTASQVILTTAQDKLGLILDQVAGTLALVCKSGSPPGRLTIECDGNVEIKAGASGSLTIDGGASLTLKGKTVSIEGTGPVAVKGKPIQLN
jgi:phage protein D